MGQAAESTLLTTAPARSDSTASRPPEAADALLPLSMLEPGAIAIVESVDVEGPLGRRLLDLGFVPNTLVEMRRRAPMGDPAEYELRGTRLCLRRSEAARIRVRRA